ncbi:hypothetical protein ACTXT7_006215 [Hymenolepis weldensis]
MTDLVHITTKLRYLLRGRSLGRKKGFVAGEVDKDKKSRASVGNAEKYRPSNVMVSGKESEKTWATSLCLLGHMQLANLNKFLDRSEEIETYARRSVI